jgi:hypothetical protein
LLLKNRKINDAVNAYLELMKVETQKKEFDFIKLNELVNLINIIPMSSIQDSQLNEIKTFSFLFGIYQAFWKGYNSIIPKMISSIRNCLSSTKLQWISPLIISIEKLHPEKNPDSSLIFSRIIFSHLLQKGSGLIPASFCNLIQSNF